MDNNKAKTSRELAADLIIQSAEYPPSVSVIAFLVAAATVAKIDGCSPNGLHSVLDACMKLSDQIIDRFLENLSKQKPDEPEINSPPLSDFGIKE